MSIARHVVVQPTTSSATTAISTPSNVRPRPCTVGIWRWRRRRTGRKFALTPPASLTYTMDTPRAGHGGEAGNHAHDITPGLAHRRCTPIRKADRATKRYLRTAAKRKGSHLSAVGTSYQRILRPPRRPFDVGQPQCAREPARHPHHLQSHRPQDRGNERTRAANGHARRARKHAGRRPRALGGTARRIRPPGRSHARPARPSGTVAAAERIPQQRQTAREHTGRHLRLRPARLSLLVAAPDRAPHRRPPQITADP